MSRFDHRFDWLYVTALVSPATGETFWYVHDGVSKPFFEALREAFAREAGAGLHGTIILVLDNAGWHGEAGLNVPEGVRLVFLPPYTPELQPAETLWELFDEPLINKHIPTIEALEDIVANRCRPPRRSTRDHQKPNRLSLVAQDRRPEVISRRWYDYQIPLPRWRI